jgi:L-fuconolactonase
VTPTVDPHQHFWRISEQPRPAAIAADYGPADLVGWLRDTGVDATVLVQAADGPAENDRLAEYAAAAPFVAGVVGWLPVTEPEQARHELARLRSHPQLSSRLCGVRCAFGRQPLPMLAGTDTVSFFAELAETGLAWDIVPVTESQRDSVVRLAQAVPELRIVVDHLARPPLETGGWDPWAQQVAELAACPNIALKVSVGIDVLESWPSWDGSALTKYIDHVVQSFGTDRLMLATNWPVVLIRADYRRAWRDATECARSAGVTGAGLDDLLGGTATRWYRLNGLEQSRPPI